MFAVWSRHHHIPTDQDERSGVAERHFSLSSGNNPARFIFLQSPVLNLSHALLCNPQLLTSLLKRQILQQTQL
jgi:hypothetical protein